MSHELWMPIVESAKKAPTFDNRRRRLALSHRPAGGEVHQHFSPSGGRMKRRRLPSSFKRGR
jgi:hypothetical protein